MDVSESSLHIVRALAPPAGRHSAESGGQSKHSPAPYTLHKDVVGWARPPQPTSKALGGTRAVGGRSADGYCASCARTSRSLLQWDLQWDRHPSICGLGRCTVFWAFFSLTCRMAARELAQDSVAPSNTRPKLEGQQRWAWLSSRFVASSWEPMNTPHARSVFSALKHRPVTLLMCVADVWGPSHVVARGCLKAGGRGLRSAIFRNFAISRNSTIFPQLLFAC